jgi:16S rRNA (adenine1518-N6/adenine1519-N6)-dimethyltransferase
VNLSRSDVQRLLAEHSIRPTKALGQNFVGDPNTVERIARLSGVGPDTVVVEIGAGLGSLTVALAATGARVLAVEVDRRLVDILGSTVADDRVEVVEADALALDWGALLEGWPDPVVLVANLPYSVATPVVIRALEGAPRIVRMLLMVQREVGERWVARPRAPAYGAVSVKIAYWATAAVVGRVPATVFVPRPKVESVLVELVRRPNPPLDPAVVSYDRLESVVRAGFAHRRKMLRRALAGVVEPGAFEVAGVPPTARAEELGLEQWGALASVPA